MAVICCTIPDSEREWIQWKGRTARNDNKGQYAVILRRDEEKLKELKDSFFDVFAEDANDKSNIRYLPSLIEKILHEGDKVIEKKLETNRTDIEKGIRVNKLVDQFYIRYKRAKSAGWPHLPEDRQLRDFLEKCDFSESACEIFRKSLSLPE